MRNEGMFAILTRTVLDLSQQLSILRIFGENFNTFVISLGSDLRILDTSRYIYRKGMPNETSNMVNVLN